ncbi:hypothetical protein ACQKL0_15890 [Peribacillus sp. NPDC097264]|uniref:hypothetical protein n=1 Tax=unclassified Peribacillus TaxID=2675266 RepID=UPI003823EC71
MDIFNRNNRRNQDDPFSKMMFGTRNNEPEEEPEKEETQIDYMQLMASVETLVGLYDQFKPTIQKVNPIISKMLKKEE